MKFRNGFVSNSSSSSFIICSKNKDEKFIKDRLAELFRFNKASDGKVFTEDDDVDNLSHIMAEEYLEPYGDAEIVRHYSWDEYVNYLRNEYPNKAEEDLNKDIKDAANIESLFKEGFIVFEGSMPDYGMGGSAMQYFLRFRWYCRIENDFGFIQCDGGDDPDIRRALKEREERNR
ncbi:hypothetical protein FACS189485_04940 [Spirochaetia bacterium]|nr:hypothetical protein FACS189485_04940 [Spirochaetia bacterium]